MSLYDCNLLGLAKLLVFASVEGTVVALVCGSFPADGFGLVFKVESSRRVSRDTITNCGQPLRVYHPTDLNWLINYHYLHCQLVDWNEQHAVSQCLYLGIKRILGN